MRAMKRHTGVLFFQALPSMETATRSPHMNDGG